MLSIRLLFDAMLAGLSSSERQQTYRAFLEAAQKTVLIEIAPNDLQFLKTNQYRLCFAKKTEESTYNIVWQSYDGYLTNNYLSWTPQYQMFGTNVLDYNDLKARILTNLVTIAPGETALLLPSGLLQSPTTGGPSTKITMENEYGTIHQGLCQMVTTLNGQQVSSPFYVSKNATPLGKTGVTPQDKVLVWFEQHTETNTTFNGARSLSVEVDLTTSNLETRLYSDGKWIS